jgi:hypothetical protein
MDGERHDREYWASEEFSRAVSEQAMHFFNAVLEELREEIRRNPEAFGLRPEPLDEEVAAALAVGAVHEFRRSQRGAGAGGFSRDPITPEEAAEWEKHREERRRREGYHPI